MQVLESTQANRTKRERQQNAFGRRLAADVRHQAVRPFLMWCPTPTLGRGLAEVIHALYYLPENFILLLPHTAMESGEIPLIIEASPLANRVHFTKTEGPLSEEPSFDTDAVICSERLVVDATVPVIVVSAKQGGILANGNGYTVGMSAEAIASALLSVSRRRGMSAA